MILFYVRLQASNIKVNVQYLYYDLILSEVQ